MLTVFLSFHCSFIVHLCTTCSCTLIVSSKFHPEIILNSLKFFSILSLTRLLFKVSGFLLVYKTSLKISLNLCNCFVSLKLKIYLILFCFCSSFSTSCRKIVVKQCVVVRIPQSVNSLIVLLGIALNRAEHSSTGSRRNCLSEEICKITPKLSGPLSFNGIFALLVPFSEQRCKHIIRSCRLLLCLFPHCLIGCCSHLFCRRNGYNRLFNLGFIRFYTLIAS